MDRKQTPRGKHRTSSGEKLLALPGISEAMDIVEQYAWVRSCDEATNEGGEGRLGEEARRLINKSTTEAFGDFLKLEAVDMYLDDSFDEWLEILALEAGPKIAELWDLSEAAGRYLSVLLYWRQYSFVPTDVDFSPTLLVNIEDEQKSNTLKEHYQELIAKGVIIASTEQIMKGHIYLDVTELPYQSLRSAYKAIGLCRKYIGVVKKDIQAGAPSKIDIQKALDAVYLKNTHKSSKSIAEQLGFKIYSSDNPSGSYPLLHKYYKLGRELEERLVKLERFLSTVHTETDP